MSSFAGLIDRETIQGYRQLRVAATTKKPFSMGLVLLLVAPLRHIRRPADNENRVTLYMVLI